jgi:hypothetical protein
MLRSAKLSLPFRFVSYHVSPVHPSQPVFTDFVNLISYFMMSVHYTNLICVILSTATSSLSGPNILLSTLCSQMPVTYTAPLMCEIKCAV